MLSSLPHGMFGKQEHGTELKRCIVIREDRYGIGLDIEVRKGGQWK